MAVVKNLMTRAGFDASGMNRGIKQANQQLNDFKRRTTSALRGIKMAIASIGIGAAIRGAVKDAMGYEAALQQINRMMGDSANGFNAWAKENAASFGMARSEATRYGAVFANLISGFTSGTAQTAQYTRDLLQAASVIASSTGRTIEDTMDRIRSGMLGSTEAIEDLGINVNVSMIEATNAFKKFAGNRSWQQLDFHTQQTVRYFAILEQAAQKYGTEIARNATSDQAKFVAQMKNVRLYIGQAFLPIYTSILPALTRFATALANVMQIVAQFTQALFGTRAAAQQTNMISGQAGAVENLGEAYSEAGKAAKGSIAGFDEINQLSDTSSSDSGQGGIAMAEGESDTFSPFSGIGESASEVSQKAQEMADKVRESMVKMRNIIEENKEPIVAALAGVGTGFAAVFLAANWSAIIGGIAAAIKGLWAAITGPVGIIIAIISAIVAAFVYFYQTNETFRGVVDRILMQIAEVAKYLWNNVMLPFAAWLAEVMPKAWSAVSQGAQWLWENVLVPFGVFLKWLWENVLMPFNIWLATALVQSWHAVSEAAQWLWENVLVPFGKFLKQLWEGIIVPIAGVLADILAIAFETVYRIAKDLWKEVIVPLGKALGEMFGPTVEAVSAILTFLWKNVFQPFGEFVRTVIMPRIEKLIEIFVWLWKNALKPLAAFITDVLVSVFRNAFQIIGSIIDGVKNIFIGLMKFITGVFTGDWKKAWEGVKQIFKGVFDALWGIIKVPLNLIIDGINNLISGLNQISFSLPDWVPGIGGKSFGINIPRIPHLRDGGVTNGPMLAVIGDNVGGREVVSPLDDLVQIVQSAVSAGIAAASQNQRQGDVVLHLDGVPIARLLNPYITKENDRIGTNMITVT